VVQCGVVWCSVVQCGAVWCSVVQCGAAWCSVVQRGAAWCSVVQRGAVPLCTDPMMSNLCGSVNLGVASCCSIYCIVSYTANLSLPLAPSFRHPRFVVLYCTRTGAIVCIISSLL